MEPGFSGCGVAAAIKPDPVVCSMNYGISGLSCSRGAPSNSPRTEDFSLKVPSFHGNRYLVREYDK